MRKGIYVSLWSHSRCSLNAHSICGRESKESSGGDGGQAEEKEEGRRQLARQTLTNRRKEEYPAGTQCLSVSSPGDCLRG